MKEKKSSKIIPLKTNTKKSNNKSEFNVANTLSTSKMKIVLTLVVLIFIALIIRVGILQFIDGDKLQKLATSQQTLTETLSANRGSIYDKNGITLALSYDTDDIYVSLEDIEENTKNKDDIPANKEVISQGLSKILELNYDEVLAKLNSDSKRVTIAKSVNQDKIDELTKWKNTLKFYTGIVIEESPTRYYPYNNLASTLIGSCGTDHQGLSGVEYYWDSLLTGTAGKSVSLKDASQSEIANSNQTYIAAENGYDITLTIDVNIQGILEKYLEEAYITNECDSATAIAMNPTTGKILGMADFPNYDLNTPFTPNSSLAENWDNLSSEEKTSAIYDMWNNKSISRTYEPGSVFKLITSSIALEENITDTDVENDFKCNHIEHFGKETVSCWTANHQGYKTLRVALEQSCNPSFMQLGLRIGAKTSYKYYKAFGLFDKTGIALSGEYASQFYPDVNKILPIDLAIMSFGQRFTVTPLQMITAVSAIANDGVLVKPQIVEKITNTDTGEVTTFETETVRQVLSKETADKVASMMESVVTDGSGSRAAVTGYSIGGKTGTSEPKNGSSEGYVASFVAISPVENTQVVLLVILYNPQSTQHHGGQIAAPAAQKMLAEILPHLGVETDEHNQVDSTNVSDEELY